MTETQKIEAEAFFKRIVQLSELPPSVKYLRVLIIVPPRRSLFSQTAERVRAFKEYLNTALGGCVPEIDIVMGNSSSRTTKLTSSFFERQKLHQDAEFFIIIHDECHWGANAGGQIGNILKDTLNDPKFARNLLTIQISATAWNQIEILKRAEEKNASQQSPEVQSLSLLADHVHPWRTLEDQTTAKCYFGRQKLLENRQFVEDQWSPVQMNALCRMIIRDEELVRKLEVDENEQRKSPPEADILLSVMRYSAALLAYYCSEKDRNAGSSTKTTLQAAAAAATSAQGFLQTLESRVPWFLRATSCEATKLAVKSLFDGGLVAVRLPSSRLSATLSLLFTQLLTALNYDDRVFSIHDVCLSTSKGDENVDNDNQVTDEDMNKDLLTMKNTGSTLEVTPKCLDKLRELQRCENPILGQYTDLAGLPCLLVVVEKVCRTKKKKRCTDTFEHISIVPLYCHFIQARMVIHFRKTFMSWIYVRDIPATCHILRFFKILVEHLVGMTRTKDIYDH